MYHIDNVNSYDELHFHVYKEISGEAQYDPDQIYNFLLWFHRYNMFVKDKYQEYLSKLNNDEIHHYLKGYIRQETNTMEAVDEWNEHQLKHVRPNLSRYGINDTEVMFNEQSDKFAPIINYMDLIWLKENNHEFQLILSNELAETKLKGTYDMVNPETFEEYILIGTSTGDLIEMLTQEVENKGTYDFSYREVNSYGYDLMRDGKLEDALTVFELNTELYPDDWRPYDSYGECLLEAGDTIKGVKAYKKSLELNPDNITAIELLREFKN